jgi:ferric iron reductase protein FhuF
MKKIEALLKNILIILSTLTFTENISAQIDWNNTARLIACPLA